MAYGAAQPPFGRLARLGPDTITSMAELLRVVEVVRERGWASTWEELEAGLCSVAAPVRGSRGVIAAISVSMPTVRATHDDLERLAPLVVETADALSAHIGRRAAVN
jgi:DNA-binding IclR family transcriptional regulator